MSNSESLFHSLLKKEVYASGHIKSFKAGDVILDVASYIKSLPIVLSGSLRVIKTDEEGNEMFLYYIKSGESCIMSFLAGIHNDTSKIKAIVEEDAELLLVPINKASQWIQEFPEWTDFIFTLYQKRFEELLEVVNAVAFQKLDERLLSLIRKKCDMAKSKTLNVSHEQLSKELGTARVVISRLLKQMEDDGMVKLGRNKIELL